MGRAFTKEEDLRDINLVLDILRALAKKNTVRKGYTTGSNFDHVKQALPDFSDKRIHELLRQLAKKGFIEHRKFGQSNYHWIKPNGKFEGRVFF